MLHQPSGIDWRQSVPLRRRARYPAEAMIVSGGDPAERAAYVVIEGTVRLSLLTADGREQVMVYLPEGSLFGEQAALGRTALCADLVAIADEPADIGHILASDIVAALRRRPDPFLDLMRLTGEKTSLFVQAVARNSFGSSRDRVASLLGALCRRRRRVAITQERVAQLCGTTRVTVAAQLRRLADEGAIGMERNTIVVRDPGRLTSTHAG